MKIVVCAVRDNAMAAFHRPIFVPSKGVALRSFADEVNRPDSEMAKHPEDYAIFELGTFDDEYARFVLLPEPVQLARALDVRVKQGD